MKAFSLSLAGILLAIFNLSTSAATHCVDLNSASPVSPYTNWATAARTIQDAVDVAVDGDRVFVTNGIYSTGGQVVYGQETNRVALTKAVTLSSVNGPQTTTVLGGTQTRGVYVGSNAVLSGFTIASGRADVSGGDAVKERSGGGVWCEPGGVVSNCIARNNFASWCGGGIYGGTIYNSTLITNQSNYGYGGGAAAAALYNSILTSNAVPYGSGGGAYQCLLSNCIVTANYAYSSGGGVYSCTNYRCVLDGNSNFYRDSGGADYSTLYNCAITRNSAGANGCTLYNCTVVNNSAYSGAGGAQNCKANNSIIFFNSSFSSDPNWQNWYNGVFTNCCTFPLPTGSGNTTNKPGLVDVAGGDLRLQLGSRCINAGNNAFAPSGPDLDGNPRIYDGTVDLGAYERQFPDTAGVHFVTLNSTNPVAPYTNWLTAATNIQDAVAVAQAGEIVIAAEGTYQVGGVVVYGQQANRVALTNAIRLIGMSGSFATKIVGEYHTRCVYVGSNAVLSGFTLTNGQANTAGDWTNEMSGGGIWCEAGAVVSDCFITGNSAANFGGGTYGGTIRHSTLTNNIASFGGGGASYASLTDCTLANNSRGGANYCTLSNCLLVANTSNGNGGGAAYSTLTGCVVSNNTCISGGGGVYLGVANNCLISSNRASYGYGGGAYSNTLNNCIIRSNHAMIAGGGAIYSTLNNCLLTGNSAGGGGGGSGGGASASALTNCTIAGNIATAGGGGTESSTLNNCINYYNVGGLGDNNSNNGILNYCCTLPFPTNGIGNVTNEPAFVDLANGDLRLQSNSPCINAGNNSYVTVTTDLDGNPRIVGGTVDIGAYECQSPALLACFTWLQNYGLSTYASAVYADSDGDSLNNWQEYLADTSPLDANDFLHITSFTRSGTYNTLWWTSKSTRLYRVERRETLDEASPWEIIITNAVPGWNNVGFDNMGPQYFYRIQAVWP
jgi:parallel beta-helix repeat protein